MPPNHTGALNQSGLLDFEIDRVAVVVAYGDGRVANYHQLEWQDCERFWSTWTRKIEQYWIKTLSGSPADPGLLAHLDNLLVASDEKNKKVYRLGGSKASANSFAGKEKSSGVSKKGLGNQPSKTKDELINLIQKKGK